MEEKHRSSHKIFEGRPLVTMQPDRKLNKRKEAGFSLVELLVVVGIIVVISAMAAPNIIRVIRVSRLRAQASSVAGLMERSRQLAVRTNTSIAMYRDAANARLVFIDLNGNGTWQQAASEPVVIMENPVQFTTIPPLALPQPTNTVWQPAPAGGAIVAAFNGYGLPCTVLVAGGTCKNMNVATSQLVGYVTYLTDGQYFAAISATGNGRVRTFIWDGVAWTGK